ncbi:aldolase/citrate lyase family protein, partial [Falsiroseomonas oryziterrae]|uniref:aldolase/citrate lyase family protein n=1 Tax=Falsiroseomonas oryziterrae TaxID=2911368 RepID=UPI001F002559
AAEEVSVVRRALARAPRPVPLVALIESAAGLARAAAIAAEEGCVALGFGGVDLAADLGCEPAWEPLLAHRAALVAAAARAGRALFDVPFLDLADEAGLAAECRRVRALGFTGKLAIHPRQLPGLHAAFTPSEGEVERARRIVAAIEAASGGVCVVDGKMVDAPVHRAALRVLARAG